VKNLFDCYRKESGSQIEEEVVDRIYYEFKGQPGLTCWFAELLTEKYNVDREGPVGLDNFKYVYMEATCVLPNNNILNMISKAKQEPYKALVLDLFRTDSRKGFRFDNKQLNFLYMNGIIDLEKVKNEKGEYDVFCKFSNPFIQARLFNYFSEEMFDDLGLLVHPLDRLDDVITAEAINIPNLIGRYKAYLAKNSEAIFRDVPRRKRDKRIYEAVYHFNLFRYLYDLLCKRGVSVIPEFPTGNGKIDLILKYRKQTYALELKSFRDMYDYQEGIEQAASYGRSLELSEIFLLVFMELKEEDVKELEQEIQKNNITVIVIPVGIL